MIVELLYSCSCRLFFLFKVTNGQEIVVHFVFTLLNFKGNQMLFSKKKTKISLFHIVNQFFFTLIKNEEEKRFKKRFTVIQNLFKIKSFFNVVVIFILLT